MIKVILVGSKESELNSLETMLTNFFINKVIIVSKLNDNSNSMNVIKKKSFDFVIIFLHNTRALKFIKLIEESIFHKIIFVSENPKYAIAGIRLRIFDFWLVPLKLTDIKQNIKRIEEQSKVEKERNSSENHSNFFYIYNNGNYIIENSKRIVYIKGSSNYSTVILQNEKEYTIPKTLKELEHQLGNLFFRVHKSYIVNINFIQKYVVNSGYYVVLTNGNEIPVSQRKKNILTKDFILGINKNERNSI